MTVSRSGVLAIVSAMALSSSGCDRGGAPGSPLGPPPLDPRDVCGQAKARILGDAAECDVREMSRLTTPAGKVQRIIDRKSPWLPPVWALVPPSGPVEVGSNIEIRELIAKRLDLHRAPETIPLETFLDLALALDDRETAMLRCRAGSNDGIADDKPCTPPSAVRTERGYEVHAIIDRFPPDGYCRPDHVVYSVKWLFPPEGGSSAEATSIRWLDPSTPRPDDMTPLPAPVPPPDLVAAPVPASPEEQRVVCAAQRETKPGSWGSCEAFGYPALAVGDQRVYFVRGNCDPMVASTGPERGVEIASMKYAGHGVFATHMRALRDAEKLAPERILSLYFFFTGAPNRVRCVPGASDADARLFAGCEPPVATRSGTELAIRAVVETVAQPAERPFTAMHGPTPASLYSMTHRFELPSWKWLGASGTKLH